MNGRQITAAGLDAVGGPCPRRGRGGWSAAGALAAHPTYFEVLTAAAFEHFRRAARARWRCWRWGWAAGSTPPTSRTRSPRPSSASSMDHEQYLGAPAARDRTREGRACSAKGARDGPRADARRGPQDHRRRGPPRRRAPRRRPRRRRGARRGTRPSTCGHRERPYAGVRALPGAHQRNNAVVALRLLEAAREAGLAVDLRVAPAAFARTRWPGRLQWIPGRPPLLLDGAHNPAGARALAAYLRRAAARSSLVFGAMARQGRGGPGRASSSRCADALVLTRPPDPRAASAAEVARGRRRCSRGARREDQPRRALRLARGLLPPDRPVVVAGSLYLVGEVLRLVQ